MEVECVLVFYLVYGIFVLNMCFNSFDSREKWVVVVQSGRWWTGALLWEALPLELGGNFRLGSKSSGGCVGMSFGHFWTFSSMLGRW